VRYREVSEIKEIRKRNADTVHRIKVPKVRSRILEVPKVRSRILEVPKVRSRILEVSKYEASKRRY